MNFKNHGFIYWLPYYLFRFLSKKKRVNFYSPIHLFVCIVDHFEPFNGRADYQTAIRRVKVWKKKYPEFAMRHLDYSGKPIQHTWFYPPHLDHSLLPYIVELCKAGYGDIEMHLHHNRMEPFPDNSDTLKRKIIKCIHDYGKYGIFKQDDGTTKFSFIHGDWSLDNAIGNEICGVNDELSILQQCGCYADFTFPCLNKAQPAMVNKIYYAIDNPNKKKSYNKGIPVKKGVKPPTNSLMIIQGIIGIRFDKNKKYKLAIEYSDLDYSDPPTPNRVKYWVKNSIAVEGESNVRFIKLHTHGAPEHRWDANFGDPADIAFRFLEENFNDGKKYILHYVTAREMYNYIKKVEDGTFDSNHYTTNIEIKPYNYKIDANV